MNAEKNTSLGFHLINAGIFYTIIIFLWPLLMIISPYKGSDKEVLLMIAENPTLYKIIFFNASLIAPATIYLLIIYILWQKEVRIPMIGNLVSLIFVCAYFLLVTIAYVSQYALLPGLLTQGVSDHAEMWYFGSFNSITYFLNQLGYGMLGIAGILIGFHMLKLPGPPKWIGRMLWISGILSLIAFSGLVINNQMINSLTVVGGITVIPIGIVSFIWGLKLKNSNNR
ncbi:DUF4386 family protein [Bacteroidota bacterium]